MKKLELNQMEMIEGGGFIDGACAVIGFAGAGAGVGALVGAVALTGWGIGVLAIGGAGCLAYSYF